jgi:Tfp pilus assembly protein PilF
MGIIERLEATLASGDDSPQIRFGLASAYFREARFEAVREHAGIAVELDPDYSAAWRLLGRACAEIGDMAAARDAFEHGIVAAEQRGDLQLVKEMRVFLARLSKNSD